MLGVTEDTRFIAGGRLAFLKLMKALALAGNTVTVLSNTGAASKEFDARPAQVIVLNTKQRRIIGPVTYLLKLWFTLPKRIVKSRIVLVNSGYTVVFVLLLCKLMRRRVVVLQHDAHNLSYLQSLASSTSRQYTAMVRWILIYPPLKMVDGILCISGTTSTRLRTMGFTKPSFIVGNVVN